MRSGPILERGFEKEAAVIRVEAEEDLFEKSNELLRKPADAEDYPPLLEHWTRVAQSGHQRQRPEIGHSWTTEA